MSISIIGLFLLFFAIAFILFLIFSNSHKGEYYGSVNEKGGRATHQTTKEKETVVISNNDDSGGGFFSWRSNGGDGRSEHSKGQEERYKETQKRMASGDLYSKETERFFNENRGNAAGIDWEYHYEKNRKKTLFSSKSEADYIAADIWKSNPNITQREVHEWLHPDKMPNEKLRNLATEVIYNLVDAINKRDRI